MLNDKQKATLKTELHEMKEHLTKRKKKRI